MLNSIINYFYPGLLPSGNWFDREEHILKKKSFLKKEEIIQEEKENTYAEIQEFLDNGYEVPWDLKENKEVIKNKEINLLDAIFWFKLNKKCQPPTYLSTIIDVVDKKIFLVAKCFISMLTGEDYSKQQPIIKWHISMLTEEDYSNNNQ